ncbi:MAG: hypothetical protein ACFFEN_04450 [Candidatus Thorarchaeota archaeon]
MQEDKEKVEDFITLWRKKLMDDSKRPSAIAETLEKIQEVEKENEELRNKIKENIDLISRTEEVVRKTIQENEKLKEEIKKAPKVEKSKFEAGKINELQAKNIELNTKLQSLTIRLTEKDNAINLRDNQISELNLKLNDATTALEFMTKTAAEEKSEASKALIEDLQEELSKSKSQIGEMEQKIATLNEELVSLNEQLIEKEKSTPVDYVIPIDTSKTEVLKPQPAQTSSKTLELLCQDLQADLNKYKRIVDNLTKEKSELTQTLDTEGFKPEPEELKEIKRENVELKTKIAQLQEEFNEKSRTTTQTLFLVEAERLIEDLQEKLKMKDAVIAEIKASHQPQIIAPEGPMSNLVEDLQKKINKLKLDLDEKNKIIEELKSS